MYKSQRKEKYTSTAFLANSGMPTYIDDKHAIAHNKIMIIDRTTVITGSFNFTKAAEERNAENLLIITSADLAKLYIENWMVHKGFIRGGIDSCRSVQQYKSKGMFDAAAMRSLELYSGLRPFTTNEVSSFWTG